MIMAGQSMAIMVSVIRWFENRHCRQHCTSAPLKTLVKGMAVPAKSQAQQKAAGAALSAKRGETDERELKGASRSMYASMSEEQLRNVAKTKRKGKPEHAN